MIYGFVANKFKEDYGINCELISPVKQEMSHWFWTYTEEDKMPPEVACQKIYDEMLSLENYKPEKFCYKDTDNRDTIYGWVMNRDGVIHHLRNDMTHGLVIAALEPVNIALAIGYIAPRDLERAIQHELSKKVDMEQQLDKVQFRSPTDLPERIVERSYGEVFKYSPRLILRYNHRGEVLYVTGHLLHYSYERDPEFRLDGHNGDWHNYVTGWAYCE